MYSVKLQVFEGPLDLLLHLVDKRQLDITEISLAKICGEYEDYLSKLEELNLQVESSFISVFASLLEIKSRILLPSPPKASEEEEEIPEHELVARLKEYRKMKQAAVELRKMREEMERSFVRPECNSQVGDDSVVLSSQVSVQDLSDIYIAVMRRMNSRTQAEVLEVQREEFSFPSILKMISRKIRQRISTSLFELFDSPPDRIRFIVTFLVLLEMARRRRISLVQNPGDSMITIINRSRSLQSDN